jgi:hypothetical protein
MVNSDEAWGLGLPAMEALTEPQANYSVARRVSSRRRVPGPRRAARYSREEILDAIRRWTSCYGEPPLMIDWDPSRARRAGQQWRADRFSEGDWPTGRMVRGRFGTFNAAVEEAGLTPRQAPSRQVANLAGSSAVLDAMVEWTRRYGDVPTMADWDPYRARRLGQDWRIARYQLGDWPSARSVAAHFGSFGAAATAAGLVPRARGQHHLDGADWQAANRLAAAHVTARSRHPGITDLAASLRSLAAARRRRDPVSTHAALIDVAGAALAWAGVVGADS